MRVIANGVMLKRGDDIPVEDMTDLLSAAKTLASLHGSGDNGPSQVNVMAGNVQIVTR